GDPEVQTAAFQRVMNLARSVRRQDHERRGSGSGSAEVRGRDLVVGKELEQEALELLLGAVDLLDEEHGRPAGLVTEGAQQGTPDEETLREQVLGGPRSFQCVGRFEQTDLEQLTRVVPLVKRVGNVEPLVALKSNELGPEPGGE